MTGTSQYTQLLGRARSGEVYLNSEDAAFHMYRACDRRITDLESLRTVTRRAQAVTGFGDFQIAEDLEKKFLLQATGDENSIDSVILRDIEAVKELREVFAISFKRLAGIDIDNANALDYVTEQVS